MSEKQGGKKVLLQQAAQLVALGHSVEHCRSVLRRLVEAGCPYEDMTMLRALDDFNTVQMQWKELEKAHLMLRQMLQKTKVP